jgi:hypothetical protein
MSPDKKGDLIRNMSDWIVRRFHRASDELDHARQKVEECKKAITINKVPPHIKECEEAINKASVIIRDLLKEYATSVHLDYALDRIASNDGVANDTKSAFRGMRNEVKNKNESKRLETLKRMIYKMSYNFNMARKAKTEQQAIALLDEVIHSAGHLAELCHIAAEYISEDNEPIEELKNGVSLHQMRLGGSRKRHAKKRHAKRTAKRTLRKQRARK